MGGCSAMVGKTAWLAQTATLTDFICNSAHLKHTPVQLQFSNQHITRLMSEQDCRALTMVQKEANLETVIRISIRLAPSSTTQPRADKTGLTPLVRAGELAKETPTAHKNESINFECYGLPSSHKISFSLTGTGAYI